MRRDGSRITISMALVDYLRKQGHTLRDIADMIGLSESFLSRVANGTRSFTLEHLEGFERRLGQPLPALILEAEWRDTIPEEKRGEFEEVLSILRDLGGLRASLGQDTEDADSHESNTGQSDHASPTGFALR